LKEAAVKEKQDIINETTKREARELAKQKATEMAVE